MSKYQHLNQTQKMIVSLAVHIDCFACASRFLSAISARSRPYLRRQLSGHTIDTMLFACPLSIHSPSLCIKGHVPTSYCISTGPSALLRMSCKNAIFSAFYQTKIHLYKTIYRTRLSKLAKFDNNQLQTL